MGDSDRAAQPITRDKRKKPIVPDDVDTPTNNELSSGSSPSLTLSPTKNARNSIKTRSSKRPSPHPAFSDAISGASCKVRREAIKRQNRPDQALGNPSMLPSGTLPLMPPVHPTFGAVLTLFILPAALIRRLDDMLSSPLG